MFQDEEGCVSSGGTLAPMSASPPSSPVYVEIEEIVRSRQEWRCAERPASVAAHQGSVALPSPDRRSYTRPEREPCPTLLEFLAFIAPVSRTGSSFASAWHFRAPERGPDHTPLSHAAAHRPDRRAAPCDESRTRRRMNLRGPGSARSSHAPDDRSGKRCVRYGARRHLRRELPVRLRMLSLASFAACGYPALPQLASDAPTGLVVVASPTSFVR